ncbi:MAG: alpha,alpha-trehalose-phosphate synthase (UDP-forming) [Candidatus Levyibacteriota bacterium]
MKQILFAILIIVSITSLITFTFTLSQINTEEQRLETDIYNRSVLLSDSLKESVEPNFINNSNAYLQNVVERFVDKNRFAGLVILDNKENVVAVSSELPKEITSVETIATDVMDSDKANGDFVKLNNKKMYAFASPLHQDKSVVGSLIIIQNAGYIDARLSDIWKNNIIRLFLQASALAVAGFLIIRWLTYSFLGRLADILRSVSSEGDNPQKNTSIPLFFKPLSHEITNIRRNLLEARIAASEEAAANLEKLDSPWTAERLRVFVKDILEDKKIYVVSSREPYIHTKNGNKIEHHFPASGMVTAIEPVMRATGGMWIAHGGGDADQQVVNRENNVQVPPADPKYTLKRIWLTPEEEKGYYAGFSNEGIWPLCHMAHTRPIFRKSDWIEYKRVNEKFAETILKEIADQKNPIIFIQDFHLSLLPRLIKDKHPGATIGMFWHIPWPNAEAFSICPWRKEMLEGILGADILGFHTQLFCNNFITTVSREIESLVDLEQFAITKNGHTTYIKPFPISIAFTNGSSSEEKIEEKIKEGREHLEKLGIKTKYLGLGVDRLDYTKGILERLKAVELFLHKNPSYIGNFTFLQLCAPSRTTIKEYQDFSIKVQAEVDRINAVFKKNNYKPIIFINKHHSQDYIFSLYRTADFCMVTSLNDGMNLVAKEFVSARDDEQGVLILSEFTGAALELHDALIINPYDGETTAEAIRAALEMKPAEEKKRMRRMRNAVKKYNVYRWSAEFLKTMVDLG